MAGESKTTIDHNEIKKCIEERNGNPAAVKSPESKNDAVDAISSVKLNPEILYTHGFTLKEINKTFKFI